MLVTAGTLLMIAACGCSSGGTHGTYDNIQQERDACGPLPVDYEGISRYLAFSELSKEHDVKSPGAVAVEATVGQPFRVKSFRGLLNGGGERYGWAVPVQCSWVEADGHAKQADFTALVGGDFAPGHVRPGGVGMGNGNLIRKLD